MHLGAKHNYIMEFAPQDVQDQLNQLGVNWAEQHKREKSQTF